MSTSRNVSLAVCADDVDELLGIAESRHLHENAIGALALDRRLDQAERIDAPVDDLDRLVDHLPGALENGRLGNSELDQAAAGIDDIERAPPVEPRKPPSGCDSSRSLVSAC